MKVWRKNLSKIRRENNQSTVPFLAIADVFRRSLLYCSLYSLIYPDFLVPLWHISRNMPNVYIFWHCAILSSEYFVGKWMAIGCTLHMLMSTFEGSGAAFHERLRFSLNLVTNMAPSYRYSNGSRGQLRAQSMFRRPLTPVGTDPSLVCGPISYD